MSNTRRTEGELVSDSNAHLTDWTLEQLAEGSLSGSEQQSAAAHLESCARCTAELDGCRALFTALSGLPRFAPSAEFGDLVISRIRIGPRPSPVVERVRRWLPATRRGWMWLAVALITPALPLIGMLAWLLSQPMVTAVSLVQWGTRWVAGIGGSAVNTVIRWEEAVGLDRVGVAAQSALSAIPSGVLVAIALLVAVGIPFSAWSLVRLVRKPMGDVHYAN